MPAGQKIYNFVIIAHIDHGKSTLADRFLEITKTVDKRHMREQMLDSMELEREKGITIKLQPVRMVWRPQTHAHNTNSNAQNPNKSQITKHNTQTPTVEHILNLIDTPGHVDFQYEVSRSLQAVEGAILLVDATQGVQAQTVSNLYQAIEQDLVIIPVINKIDLPAAQVPKVKKEISNLVGVSEDAILGISAKTGEGVEQLLATIIEKVPAAPVAQAADGLRALIFDCVYDDYKGVVAYVRVVDGAVGAGDDILFAAGDVSDTVVEVGIFAPQFRAGQQLSAGEIGYVATGLKDIRQARVGDTITLKRLKGKVRPLNGFRIPQPKVFAGLFPVRGDDFPILREAMAKLQLNDASLHAHVERSSSLGQGFRCGFLGMLHLDIVQERLKREYALDLVVTTPSVMYHVKTTDGNMLEINTADNFPDPSHIDVIKEQDTQVEIIIPAQYLGAVFALMDAHEGKLLHQEFLGTDRVTLRYQMPLRQLVVDLYDDLKSATAGYGSLSYTMGDWRKADVVKMSVLINDEPVEALSVIVPRKVAEKVGRRTVEKLKSILPRQLFAVPLQAAIGGKIIARETLPAMRKDVTGYLYGGDVTRKRKLLEKQKKGKKRLATHGSIEIPPEAYIKMLRR